MTADELTHRLKIEAARLGCDGIGIAPAVSPPGYAHFQKWLKAGHDAGMTYLRRHEEVRSHPEHLLEGVRSVIVVSIVYGQKSHAVEPVGPTQGKIARYARGLDYHRVLRERLESLLEWMRIECPGVRGRVVVDTAPLLERDFAQLAGLGWIGKNTMLINRRLGSFTFLGALLVDVELAADSPQPVDHCGTCTRCLDACPTDAFAGPHQLDSRRCISYWTIEHKGLISAEFSGRLDGWVFGCDICQDVCPWNRKSSPGTLPEFEERAEWTTPNLLEWLQRDPGGWKERLEDSALQRTKHIGLLRNAALILGARRVAEAIPGLSNRLVDVNEHPTVRATAAWALGQIGTEIARQALLLCPESDEPLVRESVARALALFEGASSEVAGQVP
jgi:epoxyqueuosine reductase